MMANSYFKKGQMQEVWYAKLERRLKSLYKNQRPGSIIDVWEKFININLKTKADDGELAP